jgi:diguanylate cyclase (GGDEF)-like protein
MFGHTRVSHEQYRFLYAAEHVYLAALVLHGLFFAVFAWLNISILCWFNVFSLIVFGIALYLNRNAHHNIALWLGYIEVNLHSSLAIWLLGWFTGFYYYIFAIGPVLFIKPNHGKALKFLLSSVPVLLLVFLYYHSLGHRPVYMIDPEIAHGLHMGNMIATIALVAYLAHFYSKGVAKSERQLQKLSQAYEELATYDSLTKLLNRHAMTQSIEDEVSRLRRDGSGFVLALGDIDDFKQINDRFGHQIGDMLLMEFARRMKQRLRRHDVIGRWGGEEFLILLSGVTLAEAEPVLNDLREALAEPVHIKGLTHAVTVTFGASQYSDEKGIDRTIQAADKAMYEGKNQGKNRVVLAPNHD